MRTIKAILILGILGISHLLFAVTVFASPRISTADVSDTITVSIEVDEAIDFRGFKIVINYDSSLLTFDNAAQGSLFNGQNVTWWIVDDTIPGIIDVECMIFGAGIFVTGPGDILDLTFNALSEGITSLEFIETRLSDPVGLIIPDVTSIDGCIIIGNQPPPPPQNLTISIVETTLTLSWDEVGCCTYNVYSSLSLGISEERQLEASGLNQNSWSCTILENENSRFYYVTAEFNINLRE